MKHQDQQFEAWVTVNGMVSDGFVGEELLAAYSGWKAGQLELLPHMQVLLADIETIIAFGLFSPSEKLQAARDFIKSTVEEIQS